MTANDLQELGYTKAQAEIVTRVLRGYSNREIAIEVVIAERTVKFHLTRIYKKEGVRTRAQLMARFLK